MPGVGVSPPGDRQGSEADRAAVRGMLNPSEITIVGASDKSRWSLTAFNNLTQHGFGGQLHLVNPRGAMAHGRQVAKSCIALGKYHAYPLV